MLWFTSDLHVGHEAVIGYSNRPFGTVDDMHAELIANWNSRVHPQDLVYVLGDIALCRYAQALEVFSELRGQRILIQGNHDKYSRTQYLKLGFDDVLQEAVIRVGKTPWRLSHYPYAPTRLKRLFMTPRELRYLERRPVDKGEYLLHGHTHSTDKRDGRMIHVGVDAWDYAPVSIDEIVSLISK